MYKHVLFLTLCLGLSQAAMAVNWNFLQYSPASRFTEKDWELLRAAGKNTLDTAPDGDTRGWSNPETGAFGTLQPLHSYESQGMRCRRTEVFLSAKSTSGTSRFDFCLQEDGSWKIASPNRDKASE